MSEPSTSGAAPQSRRWLVALPLLGFIALAGIFLLRLHGGDPSKIPSALIGRPAPQTTLPALEGLVNNGTQVPGLDPAMFKGKVSVVNVWASWCVPCHDEAPLLTKLGQDKRLQFVGINYKDAADNARRFLSAATAIRSASSASMATAAPRSNGVSTACRRPSWSVAKAPSSTRWSARSHPTTSTPSSRSKSKSAEGGVLGHRPHPEQRPLRPRLEG